MKSNNERIKTCDIEMMYEYENIYAAFKSLTVKYQMILFETKNIVLMYVHKM